MKELRSLMRGARAYIIITISLVLMGALVGLVYGIYASAKDVVSATTTNNTIGKAVFATVVGMQWMMVCFLAPGLTAGALSAERERQTYDLLRTTLLPAHSLVEGKLSTGILFLVMLLVGGFPLLSLSFFLGGISIEEVIIAFSMLTVSAILFSSLGLFISSFVKTTLSSTVVSYVLTLLIIFGIPILLFVLLLMISLVTGSNLNLTQFHENLLQIILVTIGYFLVSANPIAAAIASEIMLIEEQSFFFAQLPLSNNVKYPIISPWIVFIIMAALVSFLLIKISILNVRKVER